MRRNVMAAATAVGVLLAGPLGARAAGSTMYGSGATHLLHQMDRDMNGSVSKEEYLQFMSRAFQRLDTNHNGKLEPAELRPLADAKWGASRGASGGRVHPGRR